MSPFKKGKATREFGDFQTPTDLAHQVIHLVRQVGIVPDCVLEPTCGYGTFLAEAATAFPEATRLVGVDINAQYVAQAWQRLQVMPGAQRLEMRQGDFFTVDWKSIIGTAGDFWLIIGNPPWVTNAELSGLQSANLPEKSNFQGRSGMDAITGKSNFDISEWMLLQYLEWLRDRRGAIAVLCKTTVARRVLLHLWTNPYPIKSARLFAIDAAKHFGAAVDASLFILETGPCHSTNHCEVFNNINASTPAFRIGYQDRFLVADVDKYKRWSHLRGNDDTYVWRSGIKHDCANVMEIFQDGNGLWNRLGEAVSVEDTYLYPLYKGSDVGNRKTHGRGFMLVTQHSTGEDTRTIAQRAPKTWQYLQRHADLLNKRASTIYRNRPPYSIFGVGEYSFSPWKVAVFGFGKSLDFVKIGPAKSRPVVFDDTVYFLPCQSESETDFLCALLNSTAAQEFYSSMVFWSDKRPITIELLKRLNIERLAVELGKADQYLIFAESRRSVLSPTLF